MSSKSSSNKEIQPKCTISRKPSNSSVKTNAATIKSSKFSGGFTDRTWAKWTRLRAQNSCDKCMKKLPILQSSYKHTIQGAIPNRYKSASATWTSVLKISKIQSWGKWSWIVSIESSSPLILQLPTQLKTAKKMTLSFWSSSPLQTTKRLTHVF